MYLNILPNIKWLQSYG